MLRYPAAERNQQVILEVLTQVLTREGLLDHSLNALEIGSGSGQHVTHFAKQLSRIRWQPSDVNPSLFESIAGHTRHWQVTNVLPPIVLDVSAHVSDWPIAKSSKVDLIVCTNVIHISPWKCSIGLFEGSSAILAHKTGLLVTYGPYACDGLITPESNVSFDANLREQNPEWGLRDINDIKVLATKNGLALISIHEMPANNKVLVFKKI